MPCHDSTGEQSQDDAVLAFDEAMRPPMANGEVLFEEPWHGRVFGMAVALHEAGLFTWPEFQRSLIGVIGTWDRHADPEQTYHYYVRFSQALAQVVQDKGLLKGEELSERVEAFDARPHGHDHSH